MYINIALLDIYSLDYNSVLAVIILLTFFSLWFLELLQSGSFYLLTCPHSSSFFFAPILFHALPVFLSAYLEPWVHSDTFFSSLNTIWLILSFFLICNFFPSDTEKPELALCTIYSLVCSYRIAKLYSCENRFTVLMQFLYNISVWFCFGLALHCLVRILFSKLVGFNLFFFLPHTLQCDCLIHL